MPESEIPQPIKDLLSSYSAVFGEPKGLSPLRKHEHHIILQHGTNPISVRPYRYPYVQKAEIEKLVEKLPTLGFVQPSQSPFSSPILLVKKTDGSLRLCIDYKALNQATVKDKYHIPFVDELFDELAHAKVFSKLDLRLGYHQIRMASNDVPKTTFRTHQGHYDFLVMPFGLTNAPTTFQSLMNDIFRSYLRKFILVFFDDILIYSPDLGTHVQDLRVTLAILAKHKLFVKTSANLSSLILNSWATLFIGMVCKLTLRKYKP